MKWCFAAILVLSLWSCAGGEPQKPSGATPRTDTLLNNLSAAPPSDIDRSPMDMIYFPVDYPIVKTSGKTNEAPLVRVIYSRPHRQGRSIFGALVPYGQPWRLGANEATEIELFAPAAVQGKAVAKGRYIMYCIPQPDKWNIILNTALYTWGLKPDSTQDVYRFEVPVQAAPAPAEYFTMSFSSGQAKSTELMIAWDSVTASLPFQFN